MTQYNNIKVYLYFSIFYVKRCFIHSHHFEKKWTIAISLMYIFHLIENNTDK